MSEESTCPIVRQTAISRRGLTKDVVSVLKGVSDAIVSICGTGCEVIVHDFRNLERSIVYISGNITGRSVGGPMTNLGLQTMTSNGGDKDMLLYYSKAPNGNLLKCTSLLIRDEPTGRIRGALCINLDIEQLENAKNAIQSIIMLSGSLSMTETYENSPEEVIDRLVNEVTTENGWALKDLSTDKRASIVKILDERGAFSFRSSPSLIADKLGVSRATIYKYLKRARADSEVERPLSSEFTHSL